ncbi:hypothetical protein MPSEU_000654200 [Mayamaea pseudoterrestris]|nr:hypothetical protein MPSEU_000654200 [Mayamaea pseudoterrestris]
MFLSSIPTESSSFDKTGLSRQSLSISIEHLEHLRLNSMSMLASIHSRVGLDTLRPLPMFLGLNATPGFCLSVGSFTPPIRKVDKNAPEKVKSRMYLNLAFFLTNYVLIAAMVALVVMLLHPSSIFVLIIVYALWKTHSFLIRNEVDLFGIHVHSLLTIQQRFYVNLVVTFVLVVWKCLIPTFSIILVSGILITGHAFLRDPKQIEQSSKFLLQNVSCDDDDGDEETDLEGGRPTTERKALMDERGDFE